MRLTRMDQCSRRALKLPDRSLDTCMLLRFRNATLFEEHINWPNSLSIFELHPVSMM